VRIAFAGTPRFAATALEALLVAGHQVALVLTQPDRPAGRGLALQPSDVKQVAQQRGLAVHQPASLKPTEASQPLKESGAQLLVVAAYGLILPQAVLNLPPQGCLNIHASLLPRWRGAAPIQRAVLAGDHRTGVCIMRMEAGLDTGPVLLSESLDIGPEETAGALHDRLAPLGARLIVQALAQLHTLVPVPQPDDGITYAAKLRRDEAAVHWQNPAAQLHRQVRAFDPFPGALARVRDEAVKLWSARVEAGAAPAAPGTVLESGPDGVRVACGEGVLRLLELQRPGGRRLPAGAFLQGFALPSGTVFADGP
jgi:methionyl-tRNA formyltransferase